MPSSAEKSGYILSVAIPRPVEGLFTYRLPEAFLPQVQVGGWVTVPFGKIKTHAFIVEPPKLISELAPGLAPESLKDVFEVSPQGVIFPQDVLALCKWAHEYYFSPLGEVLHCAAPPAALGLKNAKESVARAIEFDLKAAFRPELTAAQNEAVKKLDEVRGSTSAIKVALLNGVTGSGKTEVYLEIARRVLAQSRGVILLVPEIALSSQLHERLEQGLGTAVGLWHSAVADGRRRDLSAAFRSGELKVVVGARSAVFAPVKDVGLIVIDEEHDPSYKQEDRVRYHARDLAVVRAKFSGALVVLGSATPSLETRERVREGRYAYAELKERVTSGGLPEIDIVDLCTEEKVPDTQAVIATRTLEAIRETIRSGDQAMIYLNRRGFASFLLCADCGESVGCKSCSVSLTVHRKKSQLRCHICGHYEAIPDVCHKCMSAHLEAVGAGTESLEEEIPRLIPEVKALRLDRDQVTSTTRLEKILGDFRQGAANVLMGTQMLVKGHDFPNVTLVVVILADALFRWPDFRAPERALQILKQVSGRAGRGSKPGKVLIQAYDMDHPVLQVVRGEMSEESFLESERELRQALRYPPFGRLVRMRFESSSSDEARLRATLVARALESLEKDGQIELLGPSEAFLERAKGIYRWDILVKTGDVKNLQRAVLSARQVGARERWNFLVDVDPYGVG